MVTLNAKTIAVASVLTITTSSQGLLTTASKTDGEYAYNFATVPFLAECLKLLISGWLLHRQTVTQAEVRHKDHLLPVTAARITHNTRTTLLFLVPSVIYWVHNNVQFLTLSYVDPATYQILGNLKIVTTGLLFWLWLQRKLMPLQWIAILLLMVGATTSQIKTTCEGGSLLFAPFQGYLYGILSAFLSALAAVYTEWVMKRNNDSLYWQNIQLYSFGIVFNGLGLTLNDFRSGFGQGIWLTQIFRGYNAITFMVVANLAFSGLLVSWVMKFADSIMKVYATSMAMVVTMLVSIVLFQLIPSLQLVLGILTASISLVLYYMSPTTLLGIPPDTKSSPLPR